MSQSEQQQQLLLSEDHQQDHQHPPFNDNDNDGIVIVNDSQHPNDNNDLGIEDDPDDGLLFPNPLDNDDDEPPPLVVIARIEELMAQVVLQLDDLQPPHIGNKSFFHSTQCRNLTSILLVASFCHSLLQSHYRTTTTREVYYYYVTHFKNQQECNSAIWDLAGIVQVPRCSLGLAASPKGWFCGCLELYNQSTGQLILDGQELDLHGMAITSTTGRNVQIRSTGAKCILVIEKEGVYNRLSQDGFFKTCYPCILVTGKGFPDVATRKWVQQLQQQLQLPAYGLCDCNPFGISVLQTYQYDQVVANRNANEAHETRLSLGWIGLLPSQIADLELPASAFQQLTDIDQKRLTSLQKETHPFHQQGDSERRLEEIASFQYKIELEALNWKGMDFLGQWLHGILVRHEQGDESEII
jgi:meiotic recombination protein SPO11